MVRGQEPFHDANRNGKYDVGGDGFWDINQDGVYTQGTDYITCVAGVAQAPVKEAATGASNFHSNGEWFIDLPTPFIDANENGTYEATDGSGNPMDRLIGDVYQAPNGKRDVDTLVWKSMFLPVYTGTSAYAMMRSAIKQGDATRTNPQITSVFEPNTVETQAVIDYYTDLNARRLYYGNLTTLKHALTKLYGNSGGSNNMVTLGTGDWKADRYVHAQGICGTPAPGGTTVNVDIIELTPLAFGVRDVTAIFRQQPGDGILDPSRQLIYAGGGGNTTTLKFDISDHASKAASYPIKYDIAVAACTHTPPHGVGLWCPGFDGKVTTTMDGQPVTTSISIEQYDTHACPNASFPVSDPSTGSCVAP